MGKNGMTRTQETMLVALRTLIGWHFLYEGFLKVFWPAWTREGVPLGKWSAAGYLRTSVGPFSEQFRSLAEASWLPWLGMLIAASLLLIGLGLMLGLYTQASCAGALVLLALFYLSYFPSRGIMEPGAEGNYLLVNKNLIEAAAVAVVMAFRTGRIAGLDLLLAPRAAQTAPEAAR
jgi:thiosulfate dehydrogenase [quinone] large subunit